MKRTTDKNSDYKLTWVTVNTNSFSGESYFPHGCGHCHAHLRFG